MPTSFAEVNHKHSLEFAAVAQDLTWLFLAYSPDLDSFQLLALGYVTPKLSLIYECLDSGFEPSFSCQVVIWLSVLHVLQKIFILVLSLNLTLNLSQLASHRWPVLIPMKRDYSIAQVSLPRPLEMSPDSSSPSNFATAARGML